jgi:hypothetical protein
MKKCKFGLGACAMSWLICGVNYVWADNGAVPPPMAPKSSASPSDMAPAAAALGTGIKRLFPEGSGGKHLFPNTCLKARRTSNMSSLKAGRFL